jgi:RNA polymerase sigma factor (sigma-70 family)
MHEITQEDIDRAESQACWWLRCRDWWDEDIIAAAREGLVIAANTWDENGGESFKNWAYRKVKGAIIAECRRRWGRKGQKNVPTVNLIRYVVSASPENAIIRKIYHDQLMETLNDTRKRRYNKYRFQGMWMSEIGEEEGVGESAVSQSINPVIKTFAKFRAACVRL